MLLATPFLTENDPRLPYVGSRDPLGVLAIWTRVGRTCIGNLTTNSNSVRNFKVLLLGCHFARLVADERGREEELPTFLRWEQLAAYARAQVLKETGFRGVERVRVRLTNGEALRLGLSESEQILSDQKVYGLWGTHTVPAEASGLLEREPLRLTAAAHDVLEHVYLPALSRAGADGVRTILEYVSKEGAALRLGRPTEVRLLKAIAGVLERLDPREVELFQRHLLHGGPNDADPIHGTNGRQKLLAELLEASVPEDDEWRPSPGAVSALARQAARRGATGLDLAEHLERVRACEAVLAPAVALFVYLLQSSGQSLDTLAERLDQHWGKTLTSTLPLARLIELAPLIKEGTSTAEAARSWHGLAQALHAADHRRALELLLELHAAVMKAREAAPWCVLEGSKLRVDQSDDLEGELPTREELPELWRHGYFLSSLRRIALELRQAR